VKTVTLSVVDLYLRVSESTEGAGEYPPNTNAGPYVRRVQRRTGNAKGAAWCASQVCDWGVIALKEVWPKWLLSGSVVAMCEAARLHKVRFVPGLEGEGVPQVGDFYALWSEKLGRWAHIGVIVATHGGLAVTVRDGNTSDPSVEDEDLQREGWLVARKRRTLTKRDRLIRWQAAIT
jgi:hypothetical protein